MRTIHLHPVTAAALVILGFAATLSAQERNAGILNTLEVQQLVARAEPADNTRLAGHFNALADRYTAEAAKHVAMSKSFVGNPSRNLGVGMSAHCKRLADLNTESAATLRELATYHSKLATGAAVAAPPRGASRFEAGAGAPEPPGKDLTALAGKAGTAAEHHGLEEYFLTLAKRYTAEANEHVALAQTYRGTRIAQAAVHHDRLASLARDEAKEATDAAAMHKQLAGLAR